VIAIVFTMSITTHGLILESPLVPRKNSVRGFIYEVETGRVRQVCRTD